MLLHVVDRTRERKQPRKARRQSASTLRRRLLTLTDRDGRKKGSVSICVQNRLSQTSGHGKRLIDEIDLLTKEYRGGPHRLDS